MTEQQYQAKLKKIQKKNQTREQKILLKNEKKKYKHNFRLPPMSKLILIGVVLFCIEILIFAEYAMVKFEDMSALYTLIGIPTTLVPTILGYYHKSALENTQGGIVYENVINNNEIVENDVEDIETEELFG